MSLYGYYVGKRDENEKHVDGKRFQSGSYVMSYVLADQYSWLRTHATTGELEEQPFDIVPLGTFSNLRNAVNRTSDGPSDEEKTADFFMWEHFTTKHYWDAGEVKRVGEIYTPWPSWMITARNDVAREELEDVLGRITKGVRHYLDNTDESVGFITSTMQYSDEDARSWMKTVRFADDVSGVKPTVVSETIKVLVKAGVLRKGTDAEAMIGLQR